MFTFSAMCASPTEPIKWQSIHQHNTQRLEMKKIYHAESIIMASEACLRYKHMMCAFACEEEWNTKSYQLQQQH